jgi:hypothetical protein
MLHICSRAGICTCICSGDIRVVVVVVIQYIIMIDVEIMVHSPTRWNAALTDCEISI